MMDLNFEMIDATDNDAQRHELSAAQVHRTCAVG
jgi:hypothetical protein